MQLGFTGHTNKEVDHLLIEGNNNFSLRFTAMSHSLPIEVYDDNTDTDIRYTHLSR
jgi:hypothetical protein